MKSRSYPLLFIVLVLGLTAGWYVASGRPATVLAEQHMRSLPVQPLTPQQQAESELQQLQQQIDQSPQDSVLWAQLAEYYLFNDNFADAQVAYQRALALRGRMPNCTRRWQRCFITRRGSVLPHRWRAI